MSVNSPTYMDNMPAILCPPFINPIHRLLLIDPPVSTTAVVSVNVDY